MLAHFAFTRRLKKAQMPGAVPGTHPSGWVGARGVLCAYVAAPRRVPIPMGGRNAADGSFSAAC